MSMVIVRPGLISTIQDEGRFGYQASGFGPGGAMDRVSMKLANILVGNEPGEAVLEMMMLGIAAEFTSNMIIAITGANMSPKINGKPVENGKALKVFAGDMLEMGGTTGGMCGYIAVAGGFMIEPVMGSRSTGMRFSVGGFEGRKLRMGDELEFREQVTYLPNMAARVLPKPQSFSKDIVLRAIPGPQDYMFSKNELNQFFTQKFKTTNAMDRMGIRLEGRAITPENGCDIISDGTALGAIQVPTGGQPIILMADRQTTGGYAKIATVITADISKAGQLTPGATVRFERVGVEAAQQAIRKQEEELAEMNKRINGWN